MQKRSFRVLSGKQRPRNEQDQKIRNNKKKMAKSNETKPNRTEEPNGWKKKNEKPNESFIEFQQQQNNEATKTYLIVPSFARLEPSFFLKWK